METNYVFEKTSGLIKEVSLEDALQEGKGKQSCVWINLFDPSEQEITAISQALALHELTVEDLLSPKVRPKVEEFEDHLFVVFKAMNFNKGEDILDMINLNFLLFKNMLITVHIETLKSITELQDEVKKRPKILKQGVDFLFYSILDRVVDKYLPLLDELADELDEVEKRLFEEFDPKVSETIFKIKASIAQLRKRVAPQREILLNLSGRQHQLINPKTQVYLRDVYDHIIRVHDNLESYRDIIQGAMDSYMTQVSNRMNDVMKTLSIVATVMMPLAFLTGLYGTNFEVLPGSKGPYAFWIFIAIMTGILVLNAAYFKWKKWF